MIKKISLPYFTLIIFLFSGILMYSQYSISGKKLKYEGYVYIFDPIKNELVDSVYVKKGKIKYSSDMKETRYLKVNISNQSISAIVKPGDEFVLVNENDSYSLKGETLASEVEDFVREKRIYPTTMSEIRESLEKSESEEEKTKLRNQMTSLYDNLNSKKVALAEKKKSLQPIMILEADILNPTYDKEIYATIRENIERDFPKSDYSEYVNKIYNEKFPKPIGPAQIGDDAPELTGMVSPEGKEITLASLKGKYVLIDFWASWCGPCRRENPNVVKLYEKYKEKGFEVYSVSLDKDKDRWVDAIQKDNLTWPSHISDLQGWGTIATKLYGFSGIPYTVLLDDKGRIIATRLRGGALDAKLKEIFGF